MTAAARSPRIVLFGSRSRSSLAAMEALCADMTVAALVVAHAPRSPLRRLLDMAGLSRRSAVEDAARRAGIPIVGATGLNDDEVAERVRALRPDVICIAVHPRLVRGEIVKLAPMGALNVHPSLLPRHRGPLPLFWTYLADDREAGVTVHVATDAFDAGDILAQQRMPLPRGYPASRLDADTRAMGAALLHAAVADAAAGRPVRTPQDEGRATYAPRVTLGSAMVDFAAWDVERVWHFLAGVCERHREPLTDGAGNAVGYRTVAGFESGRSGEPGSVERAPGGWRLACRGGSVLLAE